MSSVPYAESFPDPVQARQPDDLFTGRTRSPAATTSAPIDSSQLVNDLRNQLIAKDFFKRSKCDRSVSRPATTRPGSRQTKVVHRLIHRHCWYLGKIQAGPSVAESLRDATRAIVARSPLAALHHPPRRHPPAADAQDTARDLPIKRI